VKIAEAVAVAEGKDAVVVGTYNVTASSSQRTLVGALAATGVPVITVAIRNPYDIAHLAGTGCAASLAAYSWTDVELRAAARVIAGRARPEGRLPVPVQRADAPAQALYPVGYGLSYHTYAPPSP
jgi:beta-N-acetylhexosaminidase